MKRIIGHWTAGHYKASVEDRSHYHRLVEGSGKVIDGRWPISANERIVGKNYAAHTLGCNSGSIGVSICCMAQAIENPFKAGPAPMKKIQWDAFIIEVANLAKKYRIPVTPQTVLSHAEVQANLGIKQKQKWDFTRLAFDPSVIGAKACGDRMRREVTAAMRGGAVAARPEMMTPGKIGDGSLPQMIKALQKALNDKNYHAGRADGLWGKMTRDAVMSFKADNNLDISEPTLSLDAVLTAPPRVLEMRAEATVADLREGGSATVDGADKVQTASMLTGAGAIGSTALSQFEYFSDIWYRIRMAFYPFQEDFGWLLTNPFIYVVPVCGIAFYYAWKVKAKRLAEFKAGKLQ